MTFYYVRDWGGCDLTIDLKKIDVLPRITLSQMTGINLMLNIGFLMITFNLCLYDSEMREFNRKVKEEGHKMWKEMLDKLEKAEQEKEDAEQ
jgi:hypothetical protein